jgi:NAD(P)H-nitrite reductase large subunit
VILGETIKGFKGKGRVQSIVTSTGKGFTCDFVTVDVGATPETDFLHGSEIEVDDGIVVNEYMQTNKMSTNT